MVFAGAVFAHRPSQPFEGVGLEAKHLIPGGGQGAVAVFLNEVLTRFEQAAGEAIDRQGFGAPVDAESIDGGIGSVGVQQVQHDPLVSTDNRAYQSQVEHLALGRQAVEQAGGDVAAHAGQAPVRRPRCQGLVLVVVALGDGHLAKLAGGVVPEYLGENADLQAPVRGQMQPVRRLHSQGAFPGEGIAEAVEEIQVAAGG